MKKPPLFLSAVLRFSTTVFASEYSNMVGIWKGHIRIVSSGATVANEVAKGGAVLSEVDLTVTISHQDGESFIGKSRSSATPSDEPSTPVWGALRSIGDEALFVTGNGGRGHLWLKEPNEFEYCITNLNESVITAYCGILKRNQ